MKISKLNRVSISLVATIATLWLTHASASEPLDLNGIDLNVIQQESITFSGNTENVYTGAITGTLNGVSGFFFCYDLNNLIQVPGNYQVNLVSPSSTSLPSYLKLPSTFNLQVASAMLNNTNIAGFTSVNQYTGLQLAVWSILYNWTSTNHPTTTLNGTNFYTLPQELS